jgi:dipeptidyl-peptidase-4
MTKRRLSLLALALLPAACAADPASQGAARPQPRIAARAAPAPEPLTLDAIFELSSRLRPRPDAFLGWMPDGEHYLARAPRPPPEPEEKRGEVAGEAKAPEDGQREEAPPRPLLAVEAKSGAARVLFEPAQLEAALRAVPGLEPERAAEWSRGTDVSWSEDKDAILLNREGDLFVWRIGAERAVRLTSDEAEEQNEAFSPDGTLVAFVRDHDIHVVPAEGGEVRALTQEGDEDHLFGRLDWVYQEEIYGRGNFQGFWWSPDSRRLAFLALDQTPVPIYTIVDHREVHPEVDVMRYPKAGDPNPRARLGVVDAAGGEPRWVDLAAYPIDDRLIVRVGWTPDSSAVVAQVQNRIQTWLDLLLADPEGGSVQGLFRDQTPAWIEPTDGPWWFDEGRKFLWLSERDGYRHLYAYDRSGKLLRRLTEGPWEVDEVHGIDEAQGAVYVTADSDDVKGAQLYRVALDKSRIVRISEGAGSHSISMAPSQRYYVDSFSSLRELGRLALHDSDGALLREIDRVPDGLGAQYGLRAGEFVQVRTRDGFAMECWLLKPSGFDPARRYPVVCFTYAGPHAPQVRDRFGGFNLLFHQMLAQEGYLIWVCDNRSASGKGLVSAAGVYKNFGEEELRDLVDGLDWLLAQGYADPERVGLWGWSYGGYMSAYALTHSERFKLGIAGAPVTDWRLYDSIYTERYMGLPAENPKGYAKSSVIAAAKDLSGKLLLIHGTIDENVHMQNSLQLAQALQQAGKDFELMLYPGNRHHVGNPAQRKHLYGMMAEFIRRNL